MHRPEDLFRVLFGRKRNALNKVCKKARELVAAQILVVDLSRNAASLGEQFGQRREHLEVIAYHGIGELLELQRGGIFEQSGVGAGGGVAISIHLPDHAGRPPHALVVEQKRGVLKLFFERGEVRLKLRCVGVIDARARRNLAADSNIAYRLLARLRVGRIIEPSRGLEHPAMARPDKIGDPPVGAEPTAAQVENIALSLLGSHAKLGAPLAPAAAALGAQTAVEPGQDALSSELIALASREIFIIDIVARARLTDAAAPAQLAFVRPEIIAGAKPVMVEHTLQINPAKPQEQLDLIAVDRVGAAVSAKVRVIEIKTLVGAQLMLRLSVGVPDMKGNLNIAVRAAINRREQRAHRRGHQARVAQLQARAIRLRDDLERRIWKDPQRHGLQNLGFYIDITLVESEALAHLKMMRIEAEGRPVKRAALHRPKRHRQRKVADKERLGIEIILARFSVRSQRGDRAGEHLIGAHRANIGAPPGA